MRGRIVKIIALGAISIFSFANCTFYHVPPNTNKECVQDIYQSGTSGGAYIFESYNSSLHSQYDSTPGIGYKSGMTMRASADGIVGHIKTLNTGRHGGKMVTIGHGNNIFTYYAHLDRMYVEPGQIVKRGEPIGSPDYARIPKLMIKVGGNWESPDNWGPNHGLMVRREDLPKNEIFNANLMRQMLYDQLQIILKLYESIDVQMLDWYQRRHNPRRRWTAIARWSLVENMRYLECLHNREPEKFKGITSEEFNKKKEEFYKNQPLVLTIPF